MQSINIQNMNNVFKREFLGYFETPVAYVFIVVFLLLSGMFTFYMGNFYENGQANLSAFFMWQPWILLFLVPAIAMRLWSEEKRNGTIELLATMPLTITEAVLGKFLAAWAFTLIAVFLTFPIWITVNYLGSPDNGTIFSSYIATIFISAGFLAVGSCISALTRNQVVAFVLTVTICFLFNISGLSAVLNFFSALGFSETLLDTISSFSFLSNFLEMMRGVVSFGNIIFFISSIGFWLLLNILVLKNNS